MALKHLSPSEPANAAFVQSIDGCLDAAIGKHGLSPLLLDRYLSRVDWQLGQLQDNYRTGRLPLLAIPEETADIDEAAAALAKLSDGARVLVFFGTGGSGLGGQTLAALGDPMTAQISRPHLVFADNLDPISLDALLANTDISETRFVLTSKSGGTSETLVQAITAISNRAHSMGPHSIPGLFLGLTEPVKPGKTNALRALCESLGIPTLDHHTGIGGRFSCLTNVGLLPAMAAGLDARAVRAGAREVIQSLMAAARARDFAPALGAAVAIALAKEKHVRGFVMMPYADRLAKFSAWYAQLWAESLGKKGEGTFPIAALGPLDQHSQLQLFMDGPREIYLTIVRVAVAGAGPSIDLGLAETAGIGFMGGRTIGDVVAAQSAAIVEALGQAGRPVRTIDIPNLDERAMGALLMHFMLETILAGRTLGIDPFDQPAVELAKTLTKERLAAS